ncbi:hypothetical protein [Microtetraspora malaysiensis]|uniref:Uncharacterized protein n=1 Tax=Microtetraspora malaysiensis TaxID=161358 RepID=A0ABW6SP12_9ACTN
MPVEGRGSPAAPPVGEPCGEPVGALFVVGLGEQDVGAGRGELGRQGAQGGAVGALGVALLGTGQGS